MPTYVFKGRNRLNEIVVGERVADNREALRQILRREQVTLTSVKEKGREVGIPKIGGRKKVKSKELAMFTRQFSVMIDAGLPLVQCLEILASQQEHKAFKRSLIQIRRGPAHDASKASRAPSGDQAGPNALETSSASRPDPRSTLHTSPPSKYQPLMSDGASLPLSAVARTNTRRAASGGRYSDM